MMTTNTKNVETEAPVKESKVVKAKASKKKIDKPKKSKSVTKLKKRESRMGYVFTFPWIIGAAVLLIYPFIQSFYFALCHLVFKPDRTRVIDFKGMENFANVIRRDTTFIENLIAYVMKMVVSVPVIVVFSLLIAMLLNGKIRCKGLFRTIYFLPVIVVSGPVMSMLTAEGAGSINVVNMDSIGVALQFLPTYISEPVLSIFQNIVLILWYAGVQILIFIAAIQKIDTSLYEAAKIDGGSSWECFWKITLPTIKPMILLNAIYTLVFLSNNGNAAITDAISNAMFEISRGYGYASAMAWMYGLIIGILVIIIFLLFLQKKDHYQKQVAKVKRLEKRSRKSLAKAEKHMQRNNLKFEKLVEKQASGKKAKGGREND